MGKFTSFAAAALMLASAAAANGQTTPVSQMEKLTRGLIALPAADNQGVFVSWRLLGTDDDMTTFDLLRDGQVVKSNITDETNYVDKNGYGGCEYQVVTKQNGVPVDTSEAVTPWSDEVLRLPLNKPANGINSKNYEYSYSPNDCSAADVDGDGEYEIILKWDPSNSQDNGHSNTGADQFTGNVLLDCYKLDGTQLWRIDLGRNIRAGAHYTQFLVYDFDGDGKAELICKTAAGSIDSEGKYVTEVATDDVIKGTDNSKYYANSAGHILSGPEFLTVFNGETGKAVHTTWYNPNRAGEMNKEGKYPSKSFWADDYGNRSERYLACVAYLDGPDKNPSAVMCRGYYSRAYLWAVDFDGKELKTKWMHASTTNVKYEVTDAEGRTTVKTNTKNTAGNSNSKTAYGNGNHNLSVADVDGDGCDEIIYGSSAIDNDGYLLYATGYLHGDAIHVSDLIPDRPGLEVFTVHEDENAGYGWDLHDAATGEIIYRATGADDNGRGLAADLDANNYGFEFCSSNDRNLRSATTGEYLNPTGSTSVNFRVYWDGDLQDELYDDKKIDKWNGSGTSRLLTMYDYYNSSDCNSTKHTPNLQADLFGDWREEIILWDSSDGAHLNIFTTNTESDYRVPTLMHDHVYRMGVAWQNTAYNQPPHLGYYLPGYFTTRYAKVTDGELEQTVALGDTIVDITRHWVNSGAPQILKSVAPDGTVTTAGAAEGFTFTRDVLRKKTFTLKGKPGLLGDYEFIIVSGKNIIDNSTRYDTIRIHCYDPAGISSVPAAGKAEVVTVANSVFTDCITLNVAQGVDGNIAVAMFNAAGAQVFGGNFDAAAAQRIDIAGLGHLADGIYIIKAVTASGTYSTKVVKR